MAFSISGSLKATQCGIEATAVPATTAVTWDKNYTWQKELRSHWSNNLEQSSGRSATPLAVTVVIWTKTETVFV